MDVNKEVIAEINQLHKDIRDLDYFIMAVDPYKNVERGDGSFDIKCVLKKKEQVSYSIFGSRWIGMGHHEKEIAIPNTMVKNLNNLAQQLMLQKQNKLKQLIQSEK
jgi:hypothetical protein